MNRTRTSLLAAATIGSVLAGGAAAFTFSSMATAADAPATTQSTAPAASSSSQTTATDDAKDATRVAETPLAGDDLAKAKAAAEQAVPGATIDRAETDGDGGAAYEVHVTKTDGTRATVKLNSDFSVASVDADQGRGGRGGHGGGQGGPHQANGITETPLAGDELTKATAAANTAAPGATVVRAETDADGDSFEVHITRADGTRATVKLNSDFSVKTIEADQGRGGGGGRGGRGHGGQDDDQAPASSDATTSTTTN